jgi:cytochrome c
MHSALLSVAIVCGLLTTSAVAAPIHDASKTGDTTAIAAALDEGADINAVESGATPLYLAARRGHLAAVKLLIERGADVNSKTNLGQALTAAAARDHAEVMKLLLDNGADPNSHVATETALHMAADHGCLACVKVLVEAGANVLAQHKIANGTIVWVRTPLHNAVILDYTDVANYLIEHGGVAPKPAPISYRLASADLQEGKRHFGKYCQGCHNITKVPGESDGPNLWNIVGRDKASLADYRGYSKILKSLEGAWTYEDLNVFLSGPTSTTPGINMIAEGAPDETNRINVIGYLRTLSDSPLPLP